MRGRENKGSRCTACRRGKGGKFKSCVSFVRGYNNGKDLFLRECANCRYSGHGNRCSLRADGGEFLSLVYLVFSCLY
jgi:hypothetical protein